MENKLTQLAFYVLSSFFLLTLILRLFNLINIDLHILQIMSVVFLLSGICCAGRIKNKWVRYPCICLFGLYAFKWSFN